MERRELAEVDIQGPRGKFELEHSRNEGGRFAVEAWNWKYRARKKLDVRGYDKVIYVDATCLALRNADHLLEGDWHIAYQPQNLEHWAELELPEDWGVLYLGCQHVQMPEKCGTGGPARKPRDVRVRGNVRW